MSKGSQEPEGGKEVKLPKRDWLLLPLLSLATVCLLLVGTELVSRKIILPSHGTIYKCMVLNDPSTGVHAIPNCECVEKVPEGPVVDYKFNGCGDRTDIPCSPKPTGTYRIVVVGSSLAVGARVPADKTFASLLPQELPQRNGRDIEVYNASVFRQRPASLVRQFPGVLALQPDAVLWVVSPMDIQEVSNVVFAPISARRSGGHIAEMYHLIKGGAGIGALRDSLVDSNTVLLLRHLLYESQSQYVRSFIMAGDDQSGFLKSTPSAKWMDRLKQLDSDAALMERQSKAAGVPFMTVLVPERAQADMISMGDWPAGDDPYKIGDELRVIVESHDGIYVDILHGFRQVTDPGQYYLPVDGHPNAAGDAVIARLLAQQLTHGAIAELEAQATPALPTSESK